TCFYLSGTNIPAMNPDYKLVINHQEYPVAAVFMDGPYRVVCATGLPTGERDIEVFFRAEDGCTYTARALYDAPDCNGAKSSSTTGWRADGNDARQISGGFEVYPNPTSGMLNVRAADMQHAQLTILNSVGQVVYRGSMSQNELKSIDISRFGRGLYIVRILGEGQRFEKKIVVE
ncbi:MAG: T9SS C-terminal target domain-containing protein, partial [Bacteroidetes bacterium]